MCALDVHVTVFHLLPPFGRGVPWGQKDGALGRTRSRVDLSLTDVMVMATACGAPCARASLARRIVQNAGPRSRLTMRPASRSTEGGSVTRTSTSVRRFQPARRSRSQVVVMAAEETVGERVLNEAGSAEEEAAGLAAVRAALDAKGDCPPCADDTALWFLRDRKMDVEATTTKLESFLRWRADLGEITDEDIAPSLAAGAAYVHPHLDVEGRAVIVVEIEKHVIKERDLEMAKKHAVKAVEDCIKMMEERGGSGAIYAVWDMRGFSGSNADLDLAKFCILDVFREYYPKRLSQVAAIDAPWAFKPVWAILKPIIGKYSSVVQFVKAKDVIANFKEGEAPACVMGDR